MAASLAAKKKATLVESAERVTDGIKYFPNPTHLTHPAHPTHPTHPSPLFWYD